MRMRLTWLSVKATVVGAALGVMLPGSTVGAQDDPTCHCEETTAGKYKCESPTAQGCVSGTKTCWVGCS